MSAIVVDATANVCLLVFDILLVTSSLVFVVEIKVGSGCSGTKILSFFDIIQAFRPTARVLRSAWQCHFVSYLPSYECDVFILRIMTIQILEC